jgi:hypothetical protein
MIKFSVIQAWVRTINKKIKYGAILDLSFYKKMDFEIVI